MRSKMRHACSFQMKRNGGTKAGAQGWPCMVCNALMTLANDIPQCGFAPFLKWLSSKERQTDMPGGGCTFRRHAVRFWKAWTVYDFVDEIHRVVYLDGICLGRDFVVLMARSDRRVLSWHLMPSKTLRARWALLSNISLPDMAATDGGLSFAKAAEPPCPSSITQCEAGLTSKSEICSGIIPA
mgnify:FL=1